MTSSTKSPDPKVLRLEELVRRVKEGDIKLPKFQRPFVWKQRDVLALWDSIYRGYPIGSLLLWLTTQRLASEREIGELNVEPRAEEYPTNYLLDGQQRLSSLCGVLYWPGKNPDSHFNVAFDLKTEQFFHPEQPLKPWQFSMNHLLETTDFLEQCKSLEGLADRKELDQRATQLLSAIKDYKVAAVILGDMTLEKVGPVFERINSKGRRLTIVDLMRAATWSDTFDINTAFREVRAALEPTGFGNVDDKAILRNIAAACGKGLTVEGIEKLRDVERNALVAACNDVRAAYALAADFLQRDVGVPTSYILPYQMQLTLLAEFFRIRRHPAPMQRRELVRWFWCTSLSGYFRGANSKRMKEDLEAIQSFATDPHNGSPAEAAFSDAAVTPEAFLAPFALSNASGKTFALLLASAAPKSLIDGSKVDANVVLAKANRLEFHHIFPKKFLENAGIDKIARNRMANIAMINLHANRKISASPPSQYLAQASTSWGAQGNEIITSNMLEGNAWTSAVADKYDEFCYERAVLLSERAKRLVAPLGA